MYIYEFGVNVKGMTIFLDLLSLDVKFHFFTTEPIQRRKFLFFKRSRVNLRCPSGKPA